MQCELCHKNKAEKAITIKENGAEKELYVCSGCAAMASGKGTRKNPKSKGAIPPFVAGESANVPPPLVEGLVKATLDFMKGMAEAEENEHRTCPKCKSNWDQISKSGRITCPACWKAFAKKIRAEFLSGEFGPSHTGSAPSVDTIPDSNEALAVLERDLKAAVAREDYRAAAAIQKKIDAARGGKGDK